MGEVESDILNPKLYPMHGVSSATFYRWRSKYDGIDSTPTSEVKKLMYYWIL